jgi:predicted PurR-regulated permease PerM
MDFAFFIIVLLLIVAVIFITRLLGAWMLRINEVIEQLKQLVVVQNKALHIMNNQEPIQHIQSQSNPSYNDSNLLSELEINKKQIIEELKKITTSLEKMAVSNPSRLVTTSPQPLTTTGTVKRMTMAEYEAKKAAEAATKNE